MASSITFSGIASGIDTSTMIQQLVSLEGQKINILETSRSAVSTQISTIQSLNSKLQALQTQAKDLSTVDNFFSYSSTTSDSDFVTVSATGSANPGSYSITVDKLATAERRYSSGFTEKDKAGLFGSGSLTLTIDDGDDETEDTVTIDISSSDTLEDVAAKINSADSAATAGILFDGTNYYLQVSGSVTGAAHGISITESGTNLGINDADANIVQSASDAIIEMDGFTITSASNEITTAIPGVTLSLKDVTDEGEPVNIKIAPNTDAVVKKIQGFVDAYNAVMSIIHDEFTFDGEAKDASHLTGDSTLRSIQSQLSKMVTSIVDDLPGGFSALSQIGIKTNNDGNLEIDNEDLTTAISKDPSGVAQLFTGTRDHSVDGIGDKLNTLIEGFVDYSGGILTAKVAGLNSRIASIDDSIERQQSYVDKYEERLRAQFTAMEVMVSSLQSQSNYLSSI